MAIKIMGTIGILLAAQVGINMLQIKKKKKMLATLMQNYVTKYELTYMHVFLKINIY